MNPDLKHTTIPERKLKRRVLIPSYLWREGSERELQRVIRQQKSYGLCAEKKIWDHDAQTKKSEWTFNYNFSSFILQLFLLAACQTGQKGKAFINGVCCNKRVRNQQFRLQVVDLQGKSCSCRMGSINIWMKNTCQWSGIKLQHPTNI